VTVAAFTARFGLRHPIVLAPMAGGPSTPALCAAVSEAGGLGSYGAAYLPPAKLREEIRAIRALTRRPFVVNLQIDDGVSASPQQIAAAQEALAPFRAELGLPPPSPPAPHGSWRALFEVLVEERAPIFGSCYGVPPRDVLDACRRAGIATFGTATSVSEARALDDAGVDVIAAQGAEAGGHRGVFDRDADPPLIGTMALVPQVVDAVGVPVIAAGGIMDGRGIAAAIALGASAACLGTAFLRCPEAGTSAPYRAALREAKDGSTTITRAFSGRAARGIANRLTRALARGPWAPYPVQNSLTREIRAAAAKAGNLELLSLWAGQGVAMGREEPAATLVERLAREMAAL
jgi:nitronate monooxygenase